MSQKNQSNIGSKLGMVLRSSKLKNERLTVASVCLSLECNNVRALADEILEEYRKSAKKEIDMNLPQYVCMAIYQACRIKNVKVSRKLLQISRLKRADWGKLNSEWSKVVDEKFAAGKKTEKSAANTVAGAKIEDNQLNEFNESSPLAPYEDWKRTLHEHLYRKQGQENEIVTSTLKKAHKLPNRLELSAIPVDSKVVRVLFPQ